MAAPAWSDYLAEFHASRPGITERAFEHAVHPDVGTPYHWLVEELAAPLGDVVDLACGNGALQTRLGPHASYLGVDRSVAELEQARARGRGPVVEGDLLRLPIGDRSADVVVSSMGLMLVQPVEVALAEVHRILRPGGRVALLLPSLWPLHLSDLPRVLRLGLVLRGPGSMPQHLSARRLRGALSEAGLEVDLLQRRRFPYSIDGDDGARLAVQALYTPGRRPQQLAAAERLIARAGRRGATLPVPLLRVVAHRPATDERATQS